METISNTTKVHSLIHEHQKLWVTHRRLAIAALLCLSILVGVAAFAADPVFIAVILVATILGLLILLYPFFGLLVYYLLIVIKPAMFVHQLAALHPDRVVAGILLVSLLLHKKFKGERIIILGERMNWLFILFTLSLILSIPMSYWPTETVWTVIDFMKICVFYFMIINIITTEKRLRIFIWLFIIMIGYTAISSAISYFMGSVMIAQGIERAESITGADPNTLAVNLILGIPYMAFAVGWIKNRWLKTLPIFCVVASVFTISLTGSRSGFLGLLAVMFWIWTTSKKKLLLAFVFIAFIAAGWGGLPEQYKERYKSIVSSEFDPSTEGRIDAWEAGLNMFFTRPFFGVGAGTFSVAYASGDFSYRRSWLKSHSMYIQIVAEIGIFGLVAFGALIYYMLRQNFRLRKRLLERFGKRTFYSYISYAITCAIGALIVTSVFGHSLFRSHWYWASALTVVMWNLVDKSNNSQQKMESIDESKV